MQVVAAEEARGAVKGVGLLDIAVDEHVLPGDEGIIEEQHGVVLVEAARQGMVEWADGLVLVGGAAEEFGALRVHVGNEDEGEVLGLAFLQIGGAVLRHERGVGDRRAGRQHLGAADDDAVVLLLDDVDKDVGHLVNRLLAIDGRVDQDMIQEERARGEFLVPGQAHCRRMARRTPG